MKLNSMIWSIRCSIRQKYPFYLSHAGDSEIPFQRELKSFIISNWIVFALWLCHAVVAGTHRWAWSIAVSGLTVYMSIYEYKMSIYEYKNNMPWILSQNLYKAWSNRKHTLSAELISNKATLQSGDQRVGSWGFPFTAQVWQSLWPAETPEIPELSAPRRLIAFRVAPGLFYHL